MGIDDVKVIPRSNPPAYHGWKRGYDEDWERIFGKKNKNTEDNTKDKGDRDVRK